VTDRHTDATAAALRRELIDQQTAILSLRRAAVMGGLQSETVIKALRDEIDRRLARERAIKRVLGEQ